MLLSWCRKERELSGGSTLPASFHLSHARLRHASPFWVEYDCTTFFLDSLLLGALTPPFYDHVRCFARPRFLLTFSAPERPQRQESATTATAPRTLEMTK